MKFDSYVIEKRVINKKNPTKSKLRVEMIINKFYFEDIPSFVYLSSSLDLYANKITSIKLMRLGRIKDNLFSILM